MPFGDVLIHAGDFTYTGSLEEVEQFNEWLGRQPHRCAVAPAVTAAAANAGITSIKKPGGPRSIWVPRRVREVGAQFPDRQGRVSPSQALFKHDCPKKVLFNPSRPRRGNTSTLIVTRCNHRTECL